MLADPSPGARAVVLGLIQGLTEFLPISSSAHLIFLPKLFGWPDQGLVADAAANTGTLLAVLVYFWRDLSGILSSALSAVRRGAWRELWTMPAERQGEGSDVPTNAGDVTLERAGQSAAADTRAAGLLFWLALATVPVGLGGLLASDWVAHQGRSPITIATMTLLFGVALLFADRMARRPGRSLSTLGLRDALVLGVAQAIALVPGVSRSGITMTAALGARFGREQSARISFLMAIPVGLLVAAKDFFDLWRAPAESGGWLFVLLVLASSALSGWLVIKLLLAWLRRRSLMVFVFYRLLLGVTLLAIFWR